MSEATPQLMLYDPEHYELHLSRCIKVERTVLWMVGGLLLLLAAALWLYNQAQPSILSYFGGVFRVIDSGFEILALVCVVGALAALWYSTQEGRIRKSLLKSKPKQLRTSAMLCVIMAALFAWAGVSGTGMFQLFIAFIQLMTAVLAWWRADQVQKLYGLISSPI